MKPQRLLGVLGGMSWESSAVTYRLLNQGVAQRQGGLHSARVLMHSVDFAEVAALQATGGWDALASLLQEAACGLARAGCGALLLATNTMHKVADAIESASALPLLHIADATGAAVRSAGVGRILLLGTRFTMDDRCIVLDRLMQRHGLQVELPSADEREQLHHVIYDELCRGHIEAASRDLLVAMIQRQRESGAEAVVLGCTEIGLLIDAGSSPLPVFDSTALQAAAGVQWLLEGT